MQITVLVEPVAGVGYRAAGGPPISMEAEGATKDEALRNLRSLIAGRLAEGAELVPLELAEGGGNPWARHAGMFRDDPYYDSWQREIAESRRGADTTPDSP